MKFKQDGDKIIKYDFEADYDLEKVKEGCKKIEEMIKSLEGEKKIEEAKAINVQENHPIVLELSEQDVVAVCLWQESTGRAKQKQDKIDELNEILDDANKELVAIAEQLNIEIWTEQK